MKTPFDRIMKKSALDDIDPGVLARLVLRNITQGGKRSLRMIPAMIKGGVADLTKVRLNNILARQTNGGPGVDHYGNRGGTPPRKKTRVRLALQGKFGMPTFAARLSPQQGGGHPTKKHTAGRK